MGPADDEVAEIRAAVFGKCDTAQRRAQAERTIPADADLDWVRRVYLALITETVHGDSEPDTSADPDALARRVIDTLLDGVAGMSRDR